MRLEKQAIHERYGSIEDTSAKMSRRDREKLRSIEEKESYVRHTHTLSLSTKLTEVCYRTVRYSLLNRREIRLLEIHTTCNIILEYFRPFQLIIGIVLLVITAVLLITLIISQVTARSLSLSLCSFRYSPTIR